MKPLNVDLTFSDVNKPDKLEAAKEIEPVLQPVKLNSS